jgi:ribonuclease T1
MTTARLLCATAFVVLAALLPAGPASPRSTPDALPEVSVAALPKEARQTLATIKSGGPYAYQRDGIVFGNREGLLPAHPRGYYHEYTVTTPGVGTRGARRIICGGNTRTLAECYYSDDHYQSFRRIRP